MTGIEYKKIEKSILTNRHNKLTTNYTLLLKKHLRNGKSSPADISAPDFLPRKIANDTLFKSDVKKKEE